MKESPIFVKSFETLVWILEHTRKFPKHQRFVLAKRIEDAALTFQDQIVFAAKSDDPLPALRRADVELERLKLYNRLSLKLKLCSFPQYEFLARALDEVGRLLGGWMRARRARAAGRDSPATP